MKNVLLGIFSHPDDMEFLCAGTLAHLHDKGWEIHVASVAAGDLGSVEHGREKIIKIVDTTGAEIVDVGKNTISIEETGDEHRIKALIELLRPYGIVEMVRTGKIAMQSDAQ